MLRALIFVSTFLGSLAAEDLTAKCATVMMGTPGELDCDISPWNDHDYNKVSECPDGMIHPHGFFAIHNLVSDDPNSAEKGSCSGWEELPSLPNSLDCYFVPGGDDYICQRMSAGHVHATATNMGFFVAKRTYFQKISTGEYKGHTYKIGVCMQDVGHDFEHYNNLDSNAPNIVENTKTWITKAQEKLREGEVLDGCCDGATGYEQHPSTSTITGCRLHCSFPSFVAEWDSSSHACWCWKGADKPTKAVTSAACANRKCIIPGIPAANKCAEGHDLNRINAFIVMS